MPLYIPKIPHDFRGLQSNKRAFWEYLGSGPKIMNDEHGKTALSGMMEAI
jgi:hypothetical protein